MQRVALVVILAASFAGVRCEDTSQYSQEFNRADKNSDGNLSLEEFAQFREQQVTAETTTSPSGILDVPEVNDSSLRPRLPTIASALGHNVAVKQGGSLWSWGRNYYGELCTGQVSGRRRTGQWEKHMPHQLESSGFIAVAATRSYSLAVKEDGSVWGCGQGAGLGLGDTDEKPSLTMLKALDDSIAAIAAGGDHTLAIGSGGRLWAWGRGAYGQIGINQTGTFYLPKQVLDSGVRAVAGGEQWSLALKSDGSVWAWGRNHQGQLGTGDFEDRWLPVEILKSGVVAISAGGRHGLAVRRDGSLWGWGQGDSGQLGLGDTSTQSRPIEILSASYGVSAAAAGGTHSLALAEGGALWAWGHNYYGECCQGSQDSKIFSPVLVRKSGIVAIAAGDQHSIAVGEDETWWGCGRNSYGQLGTGDTTDKAALTGVTSATVSEFRVACVVLGVLFAWGCP
eukprot:TRINITY_DN96511_c0_g1_i1.p1 TRINITY_DN96511_c0_g1~~TRINITY_DN96511_c0_g1_i1.p1  ORF type:complete len:453 (-),score=60.78 TRINITY_DN96511_c0_g1_i1:19-1377(-)